VHNAGYDRLRREMMLNVRPDLFPEIRGTTDSELMFHLALTFGLEDDPIGRLERMAGFVEVRGAAAGIDGRTLADDGGVIDGERLYAARCGTRSRRGRQRPLRRARVQHFPFRPRQPDKPEL
jgi:hypothetical protein